MGIEKLNRAAAALLAAAVSVSCLTTWQAEAVQYRKESLTFDNFNTDSTLTLTKCQRSTEGSVIVPGKINSREVTAVAPQAFFSCYTITDVVLPESINSIGMSAFSHCYTLEHISLPTYMEEIEGSVFSYCSALKDIHLPEGITEVSASMFYGCTSLESVIVPSTVTYIDSSAFTGCTMLKEIIYMGSQEQWDQIAIGLPNSELHDVTIRLGFGPPAGDGWGGGWGGGASAAPAYDTPDEEYNSIGGGGWSGGWNSFAGHQASAALPGDANCDGKVDISDAVAVLQYIANQDKYGLVGDGFFNADCDGIPGITGADAVYIQMTDAGLL